CHIYTLSLHDALPISYTRRCLTAPPATRNGHAANPRHQTSATPAKRTPYGRRCAPVPVTSNAPTGDQDGTAAWYLHSGTGAQRRSEEHTSELQSRENL